MTENLAVARAQDDRWYVIHRSLIELYDCLRAGDERCVDKALTLYDGGGNEQ